MVSAAEARINISSVSHCMSFKTEITFSQFKRLTHLSSTIHYSEGFTAEHKKAHYYLAKSFELTIYPIACANFFKSLQYKI